MQVKQAEAPGQASASAGAIPRDEGYVAVPGGRVWYERIGQPESPSLLMLHGGPGGNSEDLRPLMELAAQDFLVVRYDQLGSWRSEQPEDPALWQVPRFVEEVERVRQALNLGQVHLLGQSWGAILGLEYALHHQEHLRSLVLASGAASVAEVVAGMNRWRAELPGETQVTLAHYEAAGDHAHPDYQAALSLLYRRHFCLSSPAPEALATAGSHMGWPVYTQMWGANEFACTGTLLTWDRTAELGEITVPTLITVGEFDEVHPSCAETMHRGIGGSQLKVFPGAAHAVHVEQPETYWPEVRRFLLAVEGAERDEAT